MKEKAYCNALELSSYIAKKYENKYNQEISKIKLQKSLYFLFAYWGGFVKKSRLNSVAIEDANIKELPLYLFEDEIEAWTYGPVVRIVYSNFDNYYLNANFEKIEKEISKQTEVKEFIDDLLNDLFQMSDFKLVDIAHQDTSWKSNYDEYDPYHNTIIPKDLIINEYIRK